MGRRTRTSMIGTAGAPVRRDGFAHEAFLYSGFDGFLAGAIGFVRDALAADEPVLVMVEAEKVDLLRTELGPDSGRVRFADMDEVGHNPARIIPAWNDFASQHGGEGKALRGIGEPVSPGRSAEALVECQRHESLLNLAFAGANGFWLLCAYDTGSLEPAVVEEALRSHPLVLERGVHTASPRYAGRDAFAEPFSLPLPQPRGPSRMLDFRVDTLDHVRRLVAAHASSNGLRGQAVHDLVLAVNEVATNSLRYGGGEGILEVWRENSTLIYEVRDRGIIHPPLVGRIRPRPGQDGGFGLWLVHRLCDLVQLRTFPEGNVVRIHMNIEDREA